MRSLLFATILLISYSATGQDTLLNKQLDEVRIHINLEKEIAFEDQKYFILDFHIGERGNFLLLKHLNHYFVYSLSLQFKIEDRLRVDFKPEVFFNDCFGFLHIIGRDSIYQLETVDDQLLIYESNPIEFYHSFLEPCIGNHPTQLVIRKHRNFNQTTIFCGVNKETHELNTLYTVEDPILVKSAQDTYDSLIQNAPGITAAVSEIRGYDLDQTYYHDYIHDHNESKTFFEQIITLPGYHPAFIQNDSTYIFDNLNSVLVILNSLGKVQRSIPIQHLKSVRIQQDKKRNRFYAVHEENGAQIYTLLSPDNFNPLRKTKIGKHAYPKKMLIFNGYVYYLYKTSVDDHLNKLFRQRI